MSFFHRTGAMKPLVRMAKAESISGREQNPSAERHAHLRMAERETADDLLLSTLGGTPSWKRDPGQVASGSDVEPRKGMFNDMAERHAEHVRKQDATAPTPYVSGLEASMDAMLSGVRAGVAEFQAKVATLRKADPPPAPCQPPKPVTASVPLTPVRQDTRRHEQLRKAEEHAADMNLMGIGARASWQSGTR